METIDTLFENLRFDTDSPCRYYADCRFVRCNFASINLAGITFENCMFDTCDLSLVGFKGGVLHDARFTGCKMTGVDFSSIGPFSSFGFERCQLDYANFRELKLNKTRFDQCDLKEADFSGANLQGVRFDRCNLYRAMFESADLTGADLSTAHSIEINPAYTKLKGAFFSRANLEGLVAHVGIRLVD